MMINFVFLTFSKYIYSSEVPQNMASNSLFPEQTQLIPPNLPHVVSRCFNRIVLGVKTSKSINITR